MFSKSDWRRRPTAKTIAGYVRLTKAALSVCVAVAVFCGNGCKKKSETEKQENKPSGKVIINAPLPGEPILRIHWLGKKRIAAETNSASLLDIWDLPESLSVQSRFLDQLALAPWRLLPGNTNYSVTNAASILLRPLLDDILENEVYLEVSRLTNQPPELALSVKLDASRAALWQTSLPAIWNSLSAATNLPGGKNESAWPQGKLEVRHSGDWTLIGIGRPDNPLLKMLEVTIRANTQLAPGASRLWLEGDIMMSKLARKPAWLPLDIPDVKIALTGNPQGVSTKAILDFPTNLPFEIEPWKVPTNMIHGPIHGFSALQGFRFLIDSNPTLKELFGESPNQLFTWSQTPYSGYVYGAVPSDDASNAVPRIADFLLTKGNPWLATNAVGRFERTEQGVFCTAGNPLLGPYLELLREVSGDYIVAGLGRSDVTNQPAPPWLLDELAAQTNVVLYEREVTGGRVPSWLYLGQALRIIFWKAQLPPDSPAAKWFTNVPPKLGSLLTVVSKTGPAQLTVNRSSSLGLNAIELHLLCDWMESAEFPRGLHTTVAKGMIRPGSRRSTNAVPSSITVTNR